MNTEIEKKGWKVLVLVLAARLLGPVINSHLTPRAITEKLFLNLVFGGRARKERLFLGADPAQTFRKI